MSEELPPGVSDEDPPSSRPTSPLRQVVGLFLVPLLVVVLCVVVFVGFGWIAYDRHSVGDYLNDLRDTRQIFSHRRKQAAYELSKILSAKPEALLEEPGGPALLRKLFSETDDLWVRRYLALVLGHTGDPEAVPLLLEAVDDDDSQTRIYALWALGAIGHPSSTQALVEATSDPDPGIRKTAAFALGGAGAAAGIGSLERLLEDAVADVRWNAALALAELGSDEGVEVLAQMLDRSLLAQVQGITPKQQEEAMIGAVRALARLDTARTRSARSTVERLARQDPSLKVRQAALEAQKAWSEGS